MPALQAQHVVHESAVDPSQRSDDDHFVDDAAGDDARRHVALLVAAPPETAVSEPDVGVVVLRHSRSRRQRAAQSIRPVRVVRRKASKNGDRRRRHTSVTNSETCAIEMKLK